MSQKSQTSSPERPRFWPREAFPPYAFVPGQRPHPISDPQGHSFGKAEPLDTIPDHDSWPRCRSYLRGLDLFNFGYYWEAHEVWEGLWKAIDRNDPRSSFIQGLIHMAAAGVKVREGQPEGVRSHALKAQTHFQRLLAGDREARRHFFGLDINSLLGWVETMFSNADQWSPFPGLEVAIVFPFVLEPVTEQKTI